MPFDAYRLRYYSMQKIRNKSSDNTINDWTESVKLSVIIISKPIHHLCYMSDIKVIISYSCTVFKLI